MTQEEIDKIEEENRKLKEENERLKNLSPKERLYDKVHVSVKTMDMIIGALLVLLVAVIILGLINR